MRNQLSRFVFMERENVGGDFNKGLLFFKMVCTSITTEGATLFVPCTTLPFCNYYKMWF
jgi:hypothetical protein